MTTVGYSGTALEKKLGLKEGLVIRLLNEPDDYFGLFENFPVNVKIRKTKSGKKNFIHFFTTKASELKQRLPLLMTEIEQDGMIWVSWPKKASKVPTDITEDIIRNFAIDIGLVDVKVCAVDNIWSGLKLVIPVKNRK